MATPQLDEAAIFIAARQMADRPARRQYVAHACAEDRALRARVEALLRVYDEEPNFLESPAEGVASEGDTLIERPGMRVGSYKLVEQIGEGGFGVVFMAEQEHPVRRKVAVKILKPGMDTRQVVARFEAERQALALMEHPNIARVLDGGQTTSGRPYFVMDLVKGMPITRYCDEHQLAPRERLALFMPVCQAVQHAHQKGIIHRDLKPTNVLIAAYDGQPAPKVIDFGVAKALGERLTERTLVTGFGGIIGTLEYMSPEQAEFNALDVDTRADVYSLGVLLYELLTGTTPLTKERLQQAGVTEVLRLIREEEPPKPSTRLSDSKEALASISAQRKLEPARLTKEVQGELDWIVMKALEKDRNRRYATANALARDLDRYLNDEPVEACPPSAIYRLRKIARKNRRLLAALAAIAVLLTLGTAISLWQAVKATRAEHQALNERDAKEEARQAEAEERQRADEEAAVAKAVNEFLQNDLLGQADISNQPEAGIRNRNITVRALLDRAASKIHGKFQGQEATEAAIRLTLGQAYRALGEYSKAETHLERSRDLRAQKWGADHLDTLKSTNALAVAYKAHGRLDEAEILFKCALEGYRSKLGVDHQDTLVSTNNLAALYKEREQYEKAEPLFKQAMEGWQAKLGADNFLTLVAANNLALVYLFRGRYDEAEPLFKRVLAAWRAQVGADHPATLIVMDNLAGLYMDRGGFNEAEPLFKQVLAARRGKLGADHPDTLTTLNNLGMLYRDHGHFEEGEKLLLEAIAGARTKLGLHHSITQNAIDNLTYLHSKRKNPQLAEPMLRELVAHLREHGSEESLARQLYVLSINLLEQEKYADAERLAQESLAIRTKKEADLWSTFSTQSVLGRASLGQKNYAQAEPLLLGGYQGMRTRAAKIPRNSRVRLTQALEYLVELYDGWGKPDKAAQWREQLSAEKSEPKKSK